MPIVTYVAPYSTFRGVVRSGGSLGGQVTYPVGRANYSRAWVQPANPESAHQVTIRALLAAAAQGYAALTEAQADAWRAAASGIYRTNAAGQTYELSGAHLYAMINLYRTMHAQSPTTTPPALTAPGAITSVYAVTVTGTTLIVRCTHALHLSVDWIFARVTAPLGGAARNARPSDYRVSTPTYAASYDLADVSPLAISLIGTNLGVTVGDYIGVDLLPLGPTYYPGVARREPNILVESET